MAELSGEPGVPPVPDLPDAARRKFIHRMLNMTLGLWVVSGVAAVGYVGGQFVWPRRDGTTTGGERTASFPAADLDRAPMVKVLVEGEPVGVFRSDGTLHALGLVCTHLGCLVAWKAEEGEMVCPCHGSRFDPNGAVLQGPAPAPLKHYEVRQAGDMVVVG